MKVAQRSQKGIIQLLKTRNIPFKSYWISNIIVIDKAPIRLINELSQRDDVKEIRSNRVFKANLGDIVESSSKTPRSTIEWNIEKVLFLKYH